MSTAAEALSKYRDRPLLIGVTVLTSMDKSQLSAVGHNTEPKDLVCSLAKLVKDSGLDGVVSSAQEVELIKSRVNAPFICVTPGIRPAGSAVGDQIRVMTPAQAIKAGSDYLVIGRPITRSEDPQKALFEINESIS